MIAIAARRMVLLQLLVALFGCALLLAPAAAQDHQRAPGSPFVSSLYSDTGRCLLDHLIRLPLPIIRPPSWPVGDDEATRLALTWDGEGPFYAAALSEWPRRRSHRRAQW